MGFVKIMMAGLAVLLVVGMGTTSGQATRPASPVPMTQPAQTKADPAIEALLTNLGSDQWTQRQSAQRGLAERGLSVRQRLLDLVRQTDDEAVRAGAEVVLAQIAEDQRNGVSLISLHMRGASPRQVVDELARQAGARILPSPPGLWIDQITPLLDIDLDNQPFWLAMRQICLQTGLSLHDRGGMHIGKSGDDLRLFGNAPFLVEGPFMVLITGVQQVRFLNFDRPAKQASGSCLLQLVICVEPKIRVLQSQGRPAVELAIDEKGNSLLGGQDSPMVSAGGLTGHWIYHQRLDLNRPPGSGQRIAHLKGSTRFNVQVRSSPPQARMVTVPFEFRDIPLP